MEREEGIIFGALEFEANYLAQRLGFNNDGTTPSMLVPESIGTGEIYHAKPWGRDNIAVANAVLKDEDEPSYYLRTFEGLDPPEMDSLSSEERKRHYDLFLQNLVATIRPEYRVSQDELRERLEELARANY